MSEYDIDHVIADNNIIADKEQRICELEKELSTMAAQNVALREALLKISCGTVDHRFDTECPACEGRRKALSLPKSHHEKRVEWMAEVIENLRLTINDTEEEPGTRLWVKELLDQEPKPESKEG